jgi:DNA polymerase III alpha subunit (gram-positive type)
VIYFSIDIETNGLAAGINSMISLGAAAINIESGEIVEKFKMNLLPLPDLKEDASTMEFWKQHPEAYRRATQDAVEADLVIWAFVGWVQRVCEHYNVQRPVAAAWKPGFDLAFLRYYLFRFHGSDIFGRAGSGLDIKTLTAIALNQPFSETQIAAVPAELKGTTVEHSHDALEDAIEQAHVLFNARKQLGVRL